jgi:tRNA (cmo5U34)-methyltransferase
VVAAEGGFPEMITITKERVMSEFSESAWAREDFSKNYLERADVYIVERRRMFALAVSFYRQFLYDRKGVRLLDLGSGDGVLAHEILKTGPNVSATLVDGSQDMLYKAAERMGGYGGVRYVKASFQELLDGAALLGEFDFCVSSLAIHHLSMQEKSALFKFILENLSMGGAFINIDVVLAPSEELEGWYFALWREWMRHMQARLDIRDEAAEDIITKYKDPASMNRPDTLEGQLAALKDAGFRDVDCYYKNGIFAVFGGRKGPRPR